MASEVDEEVAMEESFTTRKRTKNDDTSEDSGDESRNDDNGNIDKDNGNWTKVAKKRGKITITELSETDHTNTHNESSSSSSQPTPSSSSNHRHANRQPLTAEKRAELEPLFRRTLYVKGEGNSLTAMFKARPRTLRQEITDTCKCTPELIKMNMNRTSLQIVLQNDEHKKMVKDTLTHIGGKPVTISEPHALTRPVRTENATTQPTREYEIKGVIYGLEENEEVLKEIAPEIGAKYLRRLGGAESTAVLIGYPMGTVLKEHIFIDGCRYRQKPYIPRPLQCKKCQQFAHHESVCSREIKCSRCGQAHNREECSNTNAPKCINCAGQHNSVSKQCPKYIEIQSALRIRTLENIPLREARRLAAAEMAQAQENIKNTKTYQPT